jgi:hypothetical protein
MSLTAYAKAFWPCDEASGTLLDYLGNHHLTAFNSPGTAAGATGNTGTSRALVFASAQYFNKADHADFSVTAGVPFGLYFWEYLTSLGNERTFICKGTGSFAASVFEYWCGYTTSFNRLRFSISDGTTIQGVQANTYGVPVIGTWAFVAAWYDPSDPLGASVNISVNNGTLDRATAAQGPRDHTGPFHVGNDGNGLYLNGRMDSILVTRGGILTAAQRTALWNQGLGMTGQQLFAWSPNAPRGSVQRGGGGGVVRVETGRARRV